MRTTMLALIATAIPAFGVDGVTLINQSAVLAAGGFPYTISQPGSYRLSGNLAAPLDAAAVVINASNVTLDLNGFTIGCAWDQNTPNYIDCLSTSPTATPSNVVLRNGFLTLQTSSLRGSHHVANFLGATGVAIQDVSFTASGSYSPPTFNIGSLVTIPANSIFRHNILSGILGPNVFCPSLIAGNVNTTAGYGWNGVACTSVTNVGPWP